MDISEDVAKAKAVTAAVAGDAKAEAAGLKKIWADSKAAVITIAIVFLFIGFALGRASAHL